MKYSDLKNICSINSFISILYIHNLMMQYSTKSILMFSLRNSIKCLTQHNSTYQWRQPNSGMFPDRESILFRGRDSISSLQSRRHYLNQLIGITSHLRLIILGTYPHQSNHNCSDIQSYYLKKWSICRESQSNKSAMITVQDSRICQHMWRMKQRRKE